MRRVSGFASPYPLSLYLSPTSQTLGPGDWQTNIIIVVCLNPVSSSELDSIGPGWDPLILWANAGHANCTPSTRLAGGSTFGFVPFFSSCFLVLSPLCLVLPPSLLFFLFSFFQLPFTGSILLSPDEASTRQPT
jgi:hypothetical protein